MRQRDLVQCGREQRLRRGLPRRRHHQTEAATAAAATATIAAAATIATAATIAAAATTSKVSCGSGRRGQQHLQRTTTAAMSDVRTG